MTDYELRLNSVLLAAAREVAKRDHEGIEIIREDIDKLCAVVQEIDACGMMTDTQIIDLLQNGEVEARLNNDGRWYAMVVKALTPWVALPDLRQAVVEAVRLAKRSGKKGTYADTGDPHVMHYGRLYDLANWQDTGTPAERAQAAQELKRLQAQGCPCPACKKE